MANTKRYIVEVDADTGKLVRKVEAAKGELNELNEATQENKASFEEFGNVADQVSGGLVGGIQSTIGSVKGLTTGFKGLRGAIISTGIGALIVALGALVNWFVSSEKGSKMFEKATIGLQVVFKTVSDALNTFLENDLVGFFEDPVTAIEGLWEAIKTNLINRFKGFVETLQGVGKVLEGVFTLDWDMIKEGAAETGDSILQMATGIEDPVDKIGQLFNKVGEEIDKAEKKADRMSATIDRLRIATRDLTVENARLQTGIEVQQKIIDDTTRSYEDRVRALDEQSAMTLKLARNEAELARLQEQSIRDQISVTNSYEERMDLEQELADAQAERIEKEAQIQLIELENAQKRREIDLEEFERQKAIRDQLEDLRTQQITDEEELAMRELDLQEQRALDELKVLRATEEEKQRVRDEFAKIRAAKEEEFAEQRRIAQEEKDAAEQAAEDERIQAQLDRAQLQIEWDKAVQKAKVDNAIRAGQALSGLLEAFGGESEQAAKRAFNINKALGIADAVVNTSRAITKALAETTDPTPTQSLRFGNAAIAAATGAAQIASIASTKFQGGGSGGGSAPRLASGGGQIPTGAPQLPQPEAPDTTQQSIRAFVVEKNVTDAQAQNQKINEQASLTV